MSVAILATLALNSFQRGNADAIEVGLILVLGGAGIGALTARLAMPKVAAIKEIRTDLT